MDYQKIYLYLITSFLIVLSLSLTTAITASIGNSRMVLRVSPGETIERYVLVKNVNNETVAINITALGDLEKNVNIKEKTFTLAQGEEKKAYFTIKANEEGMTETRIIIAFKPQEGSGVGLSSTVILIAEKGTVSPDSQTPDPIIDSQDNSPTTQDNQTNSSGGFTFKQTSKSQTQKSSFLELTSGLSVMIILSISTLILAIALIFLFIYSSKSNKNKKRAQGHE